MGEEEERAQKQKESEKTEMTDNDIIKTLESIASEAIGDCKRDCAFYDGRVHYFAGVISRYALKLISSRNANIERLKDYNENLLAANVGLSCGLLDEIKAARAEAVKEFAKRLKSKIENLEYKVKLQRKTVSLETLCDQVNLVLHEITPNTIDNLVEEMTEETT